MWLLRDLHFFLMKRHHFFQVQSQPLSTLQVMWCHVMSCDVIPPSDESSLSSMSINCSLLILYTTHTNRIYNNNNIYTSAHRPDTVSLAPPLPPSLLSLSADMVFLAQDGNLLTLNLKPSSSSSSASKGHKW